MQKLPWTRLTKPLKQLIDIKPNDPNIGTMCFMNGETLAKMEEQAPLYRKIKYREKEAICLIFEWNDIPEGQIGLTDPLMCTLQVEKDGQVQLHRATIPLGQRTDGLPDFPIANRVELASVNGKMPPIFNEIASMAISKGSAFITSVNQQIHIDLSFVDKSLVFDEKLSTKKMFTRLLKKSEKQGKNCVIRLIVTSIDVIINDKKFHIESDSEQKCYYIFDPKNTIIKIDNNRLNRWNLIDFKRIPKWQEQIYDIEPYKSLKDIINTKMANPQPIFIEYTDGLDINNFLRYVADSHRLHFHQMDCQRQYVITTFTTFLNQSFKCSPCLCVLHNVDWVNQLLKMNIDSAWMAKKHVQNFKKLYEQYVTLSNYPIIFIMTYKKDDFNLKLMEGEHYRMVCDTKQKQQMRMKILEAHRYICSQQQFQTIVEVSKAMAWPDLSQLLVGQFKDVINKIKQKSKKIVTAKIPEVKWGDVGGLDQTKNQIIETILLPKNHPYLFDSLIKPRTGLLFYGPPGTGKTMLAKCIANECQMNFISVKGPEMLNMYIGESQKNVRNTFEKAAANKPCIIFFDQLDALAPKRGSTSDSSQVMDRIVGQLMTQMDMCAKTGGIFVFGATNRPDLLDPSILRPGRFDKQIYLGVSSSKEDRVKILKAQTSKLKLKDVNFEQFVETIPNNFTGADFYGLTTKAVMTAVKRTVQRIQKGQKLTQVVLEQQDFVEAAKVCKPSVTLQDLERYEKLKNTYS